MKTILLSTAFSISVSFLFAQSYDSLDINNIHAGFNAAGDMFYNINTGNGHIHASGNKIQYSVSNLWIGGMDAGNQLHIAAQTYRQTGTDFWAGTLDTISITCDTATNRVLNKVWKLNCSEVDSFIDWTQTGNPNYVVPDDIKIWPGNGDGSLGMTHYLAPFTDADGDGQYNWGAGDYPLVRGTQSLFYVYNDHLQNEVHTETGGQMLGIEIQAMPYAFAYPWDDALMNTIFIHYVIRNRRPISYDFARVGFWSDLDLSSTQTKSGSDSLLGAFYDYGTDNAAGVIFLNQTMSGCIAYDNNASSVGNPTTDQEYYDYLQQKWKNGTPLTFGGIGYGGNSQCNWMYNGDPAANTGWNDNSTNEKRMVGSTNSFTMQPGSVYTFDVAMVFASDSSSSNSSVTLLKEYMQEVKSFYQNQSQICTPGITAINENQPANDIFICPNPATGQIRLNGILKDQQYSILNSVGQIILQGKTLEDNSQIDISSLSNGMYFLRVGKDMSIQTIKFVKTME